MDKQKLLSICIPTYNRADILNRTLRSLTTNPDYNPDLIEIVISDNCSTDNTKEVVAMYPDIKYYCNDENIKDYNFTKAIEYGTAKYVRLFNDTLLFNFGELECMLRTIKKYEKANVNLFFYKNTWLHSDSNITISTLKEYFKEVSFYSTWIANTGFWLEDFKKIENKNLYSYLQFPQLEWNYRIVENGKKTVIYFSNIFETLQPPNKGGYNFFNTFINKYLYIVKKQRIGILNYELEKFRLFRHFIYNYLVVFFIVNKGEYSFETKGVAKIIFSKYWYNLYIYPILVMFIIKKITNKCKQE
ncbi:Glycosyltransferase involved in cell wall bisynthesis [Chryseobacterium piscicola]|jgi:glycosyltransferase involved in cell wall biosynthesis|uniref:Glycosyltransferase involved in cell wall bisynthesis n=1 Tax=Chryseobacterium piscicola TaxID=551459 RepID=A0A1N7NHN5_9FLAO|nr:glycosyltransferase family 2 protein [Chryseobacterium piscicola]PQA90537.1 hypothetical protein B0A70_14540 [Chryseobacterium piscicola]SIS97864.1 Glycosyltransferase involved in cell wall bisynthesis [Chryseobacterium piscicola]